MATATQPSKLFIPRPVLAAMLAQAVRELPNECCGVLGGVSDAARCLLLVRTWHPLVNAVASPTEYESEPQSMFVAMRQLRQQGLDVVAVYHSHPTTPAMPSRADLARNYADQVVNLIISLRNAQPEVRAWWLSADSYREAGWECVEAESGEM